MIYLLFHVIGLFFWMYFYKTRVSLYNIILIVGVFAVYFFTWQETSYVLMFIYITLVYIINSLLVTKNVHSSLHMSITIVLTGLLVNTVVVGDGFYYYLYMFEFTLTNIIMLLLHMSLIISLFMFKRIMSYNHAVQYQHRFSYINLVMFIIIIMTHILHDIDEAFFHIIDHSILYYQTVLLIIFLCYILLILSVLLFERKRHKGEVLFNRLRAKQEKMKELFETLPSKKLAHYTSLVYQQRYDDLLDETKSYMSQHKKASHKRVLSRIGDHLVAEVTMDKISKEEHVAFEIIVEDEFDLSLSKMDYFLEVYGILLDNAVEASKRAEYRYVKIVFDKEHIVIENTFSKEDIDYLHQKKSSRGHKDRINGLALVEYLEKDSSIQVTTEVTYRVKVTLEVSYV